MFNHILLASLGPTFEWLEKEEVRKPHEDLHEGSLEVEVNPHRISTPAPPPAKQGSLFNDVTM